MAVDSSVPWQFDGLANRDDATKTVRALLGRHWFCNAPVNSWCQNDRTVASTTARVTLEWPYGTEPVTVTVTRMPAGIGVLAAPAPVSADQMTPANGELTVTIPAVADGDALSVVAAPASSTTTTTTSTTTPSSTTTTTTPPSTTSGGGVPTIDPASVVVGSGSPGTLTVSWAPAQPNGAPVTGYTAACSAAGVPMRSVTTSGAATNATLGGLQWWAWYRCVVSATNKYGTSSPTVATPGGIRPRLF
jgi:hypothetical protein